MNKWISKSTNDKIKNFIVPPIPEDVNMYLINAIYFKGEWTDKFNKRNSFPSKFHSGNGDIKEVMMMSKKDRIEYGENEDFKVVRLPYGKEKISMYCVLPAENTSINDFIQTHNTDKWELIKNSVYKADDVYLNIPRFKMEYGVNNLNDCLSSMGMDEAFSPNADFSRISEGMLYIDNVLHKAIIEVNEEGSQAAAATVVATAGSMPLEPASFIADRPFLFIITDDVTGAILFMGKLYDCEKF